MRSICQEAFANEKTCLTQGGRQENRSETHFSCQETRYCRQEDGQDTAHTHHLTLKMSGSVSHDDSLRHAQSVQFLFLEGCQIHVRDFICCQFMQRLVY